MMDDAYFSSYASLSVHELMLKDSPRTKAYQNFIERNASLIQDKVVIDVGAGTGILSLFAAKAGARKVYAIEASDVAKLCRNIVAVNGYNDVIEVIQSRVEDCQLPVDSCDVIISEWMGFYLLHEAMLESVIFARDKWLSTDGLMIPSTATMWLCPVNAKQFIKENLTVWDNFYGFDYSPFKALVQEQHSRQPSVLTLAADNCIAQPQQLLHLVLKYVDEQDVQLIKRDFEFKVNKHTLCHGFAAWFDCGFDANDVTAKSATTINAVTLSTAPNAPPTHWQQTVLILPDTLMLSKDDTIGCALTLQQDSTNHRHYNISIELMDDAEDASDVSESEAYSRNEDATQIIEKLIAGKMAATN